MTRFNQIWTILLVLLTGMNAWALRASRPLMLSYPVNQDQISQLNKYLEDIWNMQSGRFELDIVTTSKSSSKNGEIWIYNNAGTYSIQVKAGDVVRSVTLSP